jgi:HPt (histidine-containing phosphotransfer) domain-containing protein
MYITAADIKSNLTTGFDLTEYLDEVENEIIDLAQKLGVRSTTDIASPLHYKVKRYGVVFVLMRLAQDKLGTNLPDVSLDKYDRLYQMYKKEIDDLKSQITREMITNNIDEIIDRTTVMGGLYRS